MGDWFRWRQLDGDPSDSAFLGIFYPRIPHTHVKKTTERVGYTAGHALLLLTAAFAGVLSSSMEERCPAGEPGCGTEQSTAGAEGLTTVYILRHGTTPWNQEGKWQGETDIELAPEGIVEAEKQSAAFTSAGVKFDAVWASNLKRAHRTAEIVSAPHGVVPVPSAALRECSLGEFEGMHKSDIHSKYEHIFNRLKALPHEERINSAYFEGLETPADMSKRVSALMLQAAAAHAGQNLLMVTHSTVIESLLATRWGYFYDGIGMRRLAWLRCHVRHNGTITLEELDGFKFSKEVDMK